MSLDRNAVVHVIHCSPPATDTQRVLQVWPLPEPDGRLEEGRHSPQGKHTGQGDPLTRLHTVTHGHTRSHTVTYLMVMMSHMWTNCVAVIFHVGVFFTVVRSWLYMFSGVCHRC